MNVVKLPYLKISLQYKVTLARILFYCKKMLFTLSIGRNEEFKIAVEAPSEEVMNLYLNFGEELGEKLCEILLTIIPDKYALEKITAMKIDVLPADTVYLPFSVYKFPDPFVHSCD